MGDLAIRCLGRPVQKILRNFPWPIKRKILTADSLQASGNGPVLVMLTIERTWLDALWSAYSWLYFSEGALRLRMFVDGPVTPRMGEEFGRLFPGGELVQGDSLRGQLPADCPEIRNFWDNFKYGRKLGIIYIQSSLSDIIFSDPDILCFRHLNELLDCTMVRNRTPLYNREAKDCGYLPQEIQSIMDSKNIKPLDGFNSGLMYIPRGSISKELCESCLSSFGGGDWHFFTEQGVFEALLSHAKAEPLAPDKYSVGCEGMYFWNRDLKYEDVVTRHFTGVVRHKMYTAGMPILWKRFCKMH